jgi:hypothetical protein
VSAHPQFSQPAGRPGLEHDSDAIPVATLQAREVGKDAWAVQCPQCLTDHFHDARPGARYANCNSGPWAGRRYRILAPKPSDE